MSFKLWKQNFWKTRKYMREPLKKDEGTDWRLTIELILARLDADTSLKNKIKQKISIPCFAAGIPAVS